jgi:hypothetical protein
MYLKTAIAAAALIVAPAALAQNTQAPNSTPGHEMQQKGSKKGSPGASGYTPGHEMQEKGSSMNSPGASGYAPGHQGGTTGSTGKSGSSGGTRR